MSTGPTWGDFRQLRFSAGGYPLTGQFSQRIGAVIAFCGFRVGVSPSALTWTGLSLNFLASMVYAAAPVSVGYTLIALLLYQLAYGFDCADGQLARGAGLTSAYGAWLDLATDYVRCVLIAGAAAQILVDAHGVPLAAALGATGLLLTGMVVSAHTSIALRRAGPGPAPSGMRASWLADVARVALDTPAILVALCLLRGTGSGLALYCALIGVLDCAIALRTAHRRLREP